MSLSWKGCPNAFDLWRLCLYRNFIIYSNWTCVFSIDWGFFHFFNFFYNFWLTNLKNFSNFHFFFLLFHNDLFIDDRFLLLLFDSNWDLLVWYFFFSLTIIKLQCPYNSLRVILLLCNFPFNQNIRNFAKFKLKTWCKTSWSWWRFMIDEEILSFVISFLAHLIRFFSLFLKLFCK